MSNETQLTIIGNLTADPELRTTQSGRQVASLTIANTPRQYNRQSNQWEDGQTLFMRCTAWGDLAANITQTLAKGMRVIAQGRLGQRSYQAKDGSNRTVIELTIDHIGPDLTHATAQVTRHQANGGFQGGGYQQAPQQSGFAGAARNQQQAQAPTIPATPQDPWSQAQAASEFGFGGNEPEF